MPITNALSIDVEDYFHVHALSERISRKDWSRCESRVERNTLRLLSIFDEHGVKATFFVLGWVAERYPGLISEIAKRGHEIGCHGYSHKLVYSQSPAEFRHETVKAKKILEQIITTPVRGYRAASYSITAESSWALDVLAEAGFAYDSSIFPVRHDVYGMPSAPSRPHRIVTPMGNSLLEFPISTLEAMGWRMPASGGGYFRLYPYRMTRAALRHLNLRRGQPFIFYIHPWEIDAAQPRFDVGLKSRFRHYNNLHKCEARLRRLLEEFRFSTVADVLRGVEMESVSLETGVVNVS